MSTGYALSFRSSPKTAGRRTTRKSDNPLPLMVMLVQTTYFSSYSPMLTDPPLLQGRHGNSAPAPQRVSRPGSV